MRDDMTKIERFDSAHTVTRSQNPEERERERESGAPNNRRSFNVTVADDRILVNYELLQHFISVTLPCTPIWCIESALRKVYLSVLVITIPPVLVIFTVTISIPTRYLTVLTYAGIVLLPKIAPHAVNNQPLKNIKTLT